LSNPFKIGTAYLHALIDPTKSFDLALKTAISCNLAFLNAAKFLIKPFKAFYNLPINAINLTLAGYNLIFKFAMSALYNLYAVFLYLVNLFTSLWN